MLTTSNQYMNICSPCKPNVRVHLAFDVAFDRKRLFPLSAKCPWLIQKYAALHRPLRPLSPSDNVGDGWRIKHWKDILFLKSGPLQKLPGIEAAAHKRLPLGASTCAAACSAPFLVKDDCIKRRWLHKVVCPFSSFCCSHSRPDTDGMIDACCHVLSSE